MSYRLDRLRACLEEKELEALLVSSPENRRYLSGFIGSSGYLVIARDKAVLATDFRYTEQASHQAADFHVLQIGGSWGWLAELVRELGTQRLGFEGHHMTVHTYQQVREALEGQGNGARASLVATNGLVESLRTLKDPQELTLVQRAVDVADRAMEGVCPTIREGDTEREVAWRLEKAMRELGAEKLSFDTIVAAGPNGAMAHHQPTDRPIGPGEPVVIDMGARVDGYCSDITRTICLGEPDEMYRKIYDIVLGSQLAAIATVRPGMTGGDADALSRQVIAEAGYGDAFGHSLGHGVGLAVHEYPRVGPSSSNTLEEGMVFTIEPGIYITGWGGVRIEDMMVLEASGARIMTGARK